jgi:hemolysin activation/secretion protein
LPVKKELVEAYLARLKPGSILTVTEVERVVFLINDLRGITARVEIEPGSKPGTANLVVRPLAENRWAYKADLDVNGSRFIGLERIGAQVTYGSPFGQGDSISLSALTSIKPGMRFILAGYGLPVGGDGLRVGGALSAVSYELDKKIFPIGRHGTALNANLFGLYPVIRSRNINLFTLLAFDEKHYDDREDASASVTKKRVQSLTLGVNGDTRDNLLSGGVNSYDLNLAGGQVSYADGRPSGLLDAPNYTKLLGTISRIQNISTGNLLAYISLRGQFGFKNLDTTEQFRMGGPDGVRAFANGEGTGDSGLLGTIELRAPLSAAMFGQFRNEAVVALFYDHGTIKFRHDPGQDTTLAGFSNKASYAGAGLALAWVRPGKYSFRFSMAKPTKGEPKGDAVVRSPRVYAQFSAYF